MVALHLRRVRRRSLVWFAAFAVLAVATGLVVAQRGDRADGDAAPPPGCPTAPPATTVPPTTAAPTVAGLAVGSVGPEVAALQRRLDELGFWLPGGGDRFTEATTHAVVAFQKLAGLARDGVVGPATRAALASADRPQARYGGAGRWVEVDLTHQVLLVVRDGWVERVIDVSTGRVSGTTPIGDWTVTREIDGWRHGPLGTLYRPKYFHGGVAVHGSPEIPPYPASHGCVRTQNVAMDWLWEVRALDIGTPVRVYA